MESKKINQISVDIPNYNGPLEVLLDLAKTQKVDLAEFQLLNWLINFYFI